MQIGKHNRKLVEVRKAFHHGTLTADGLLPLEGPILLQEAARSGLEIVDIFVRQGTTGPPVPAATYEEIPEDLFKTIQDTEHSQGIVATVRPREFRFDDLFDAGPALIVVLARLQDPGNVGTILRIAESFGATGCAATPGTAGFYNSKTVRASAGSVFRLPHLGGIAFELLTAELRRRRIAIVGTSPAVAGTIDQWDWNQPSAVLIGNEGGGLSPDEMSVCDRVLRIPQKRTVESLNSAVATAVTLYEASKQRL